MKKKVLLLALTLLFSLVLKAQSIKQIDGKKIYYIQVILDNAGQHKNIAAVDYGNSIIKNNKFEYEYIKDANGELMYFYNKLSMINYMTLQGWTYMSSIDGILNANEWSTFAKEMTDAEAKELMLKMTYKEPNK